MPDTFSDIGAPIVGDDEAAARDEIDQTFEGDFDGFKIGVDVGMIELNVGEDQHVGKVVQELWAFIEERGVVLVAFDDEGARGPEMKTGAEVFRYAADEEGRLERGILTRSNLINPSEHAGGRGFAVRSRDDERFAASEEFCVEKGRQRPEGNPLVQDVFDFRIAARECVADDDEIGRGVEVGFRVGLENGNAERTKQVAHGRIGCIVGACDAVTLQLEKAGQRGHRSAADASEVDVASSGHAATAGCRRRNSAADAA